MRQKICAIIFAVCFFIALGIVGGIEQGEPLENSIWALLALLVGGICIKIARFEEEV